MAEHSVGQLKLRIRAGPSHATSARELARTLTQRGLERAGEILERRFPHRVILIRRLTLHVSASPKRLASDTLVQQLARELAERIGQKLRSGLRADGEFVTYDSRSAWLADALVAEADGRCDKPWHLARLGSPARLIRQLCTTDAEHSPLRTLSILHEAGRLPDALRGLNRAELIRLAEALEIGAPQDAGPRTATVAARPLDLVPPPGPAAAGGRAMAAWGAVSDERIIQRIRDQVGSAAASQRTKSTEGRTPHASRGSARKTRRSDDQAPESPDSRHEAARTRPEPAAHGTEYAHRSRDRLPAPTSESQTIDPDTPVAGTCITELGGLFYLLSLALELEVGKTLWKACLPEQQVLSQAARALVADRWPHDPAPRIMGTLTEPEVPLTASPEQVREVVTALFQAFVHACPRRGLGSVPDLGLRLAAAHGEPVLCVTAIGSPFVLYAAPSGSTDQCRTAMDQILCLWTESEATLYATPELVQIDSTGRLRLRGRSPADPDLFLPPAANVASSMLLGVAIGVLCQIFAVRVKQPSISDLGQLTDRYFARPATVEIDKETIRVMMPSDAIDLSVRRAGLDRDPGWVPWLKRTVKFLFRGATEPS